LLKRVVGTAYARFDWQVILSGFGVLLVQEMPKVASVFDSEEEHVGEVYAKALLGVARKSSNTDELLSQFQTGGRRKCLARIPSSKRL
jgi:hypothetical protein